MCAPEHPCHPRRRRQGFVLGLSFKEAVFLSALSALIVAAKVVLRFPVKVPGHANIFILFFMVTGRLAVGRLGAGTFMGLVSGVLLAATGQSREGAWVFFKFLGPGIAVDGLAAVLPRRARWWSGLAMGAVGGATRALISYAVRIGLGLDERVGLTILGFMLASHVPFGGLGGLLSVPILGRLQRAGVLHIGPAGTDPPPPSDPSTDESSR